MPWRPSLLRAVVIVCSIAVVCTCTQPTETPPPRGFSSDRKFVGDAATVVATARAWATHERRLSRFPDPSDASLFRYLGGDLLALVRIDLLWRTLAVSVGARPPVSSLVRRIDEVRVAGDRAVIEECNSERTRVVNPRSRIATGGLVAVTATRLVARRTESGWRLVSRTTHPSPGTAWCQVSR